MSTLTLLGIALGLAMDAFAVAIGAGLQLCNVTKRQTFRLAWHFGLFQAFMPILGWLAGLTLVDYIAPVDHWIAFGLLAFIGGKMIYEALKHDDEEADRCDPTKGWRLVMLSVATSIDALAVGLSMALLGVEHLVARAGDRHRRRRPYGGRPRARLSLRLAARAAHGDRRRPYPHRDRRQDPRRAPGGVS